MTFSFSPQRNILNKSDGIALFVAILVMTVVMLFVGASLFLSRVDSKITSNYKLATQSLEVANAGLLHAMTLIEDGFDFDTNLNCGTPPCTLLSSTTFPAGSDFAYTVTVENDSPDINSSGSSTDDTDNIVVLLSTASGPNGTKRELQAYVNRSLVSFSPPSAVYIPSSSGTGAFDFGKANNPGMFITGDDTSYTDSNSDGYAESTASGTEPSISGVSTIFDAVKTTFLSLLGVGNESLVQGSGYSADPLTASVSTTADVFDVNQIALNFYNNGSAVKVLNGLKLDGSDCPSNNPCVYGTDASPQITYVREGSDHIHLTGNITGSGVWVTEGKNHLYGDFEFHGLVIGVKEGLTGGTDPGTVNSDYFSLRNNAKIFGAVFIGPTDSALGFQIQDNGKVYYNSSAIDMANSLCGACFPQPPRIFSWFDK
jgi:Tfp pilus assembly protein PilX